MPRDANGEFYCWRGHDPERFGSSKYERYCKECHRRRMWFYRTRRTPPKMPYYRLKCDVFKRYAHGRIEIVAQLADLSLDTLREWTRRKNFNGKRGRANPKNAEALSAALGLKLEELWNRVQ